MFIALMAATLVAPSPHAAVSVGSGNGFGGVGLQAEGGVGPVTAAVGLSGVTLSGRAVAGALTLKWMLDDGGYLFAGASAWADLRHQTRLSSGGVEYDVDRWFTVSAGTGVRWQLGNGLFVDTSWGLPLTVSRDWPSRYDYDTSGTPQQGPAWNVGAGPLRRRPATSWA